MKKTQRYIITGATNSRNAALIEPKGRGLSFVGSVKTKWVHLDNEGKGYNLTEARNCLQNLFERDSVANRMDVHHKYFENTYQSGEIVYSIEAFEPENTR